MNTTKMHELMDSLALSLSTVLPIVSVGDSKEVADAKAALENYRAWKIVYKARGPKKSKVS